MAPEIATLCGLCGVNMDGQGCRTFTSKLENLQPCRGQQPPREAKGSPRLAVVCGQGAVAGGLGVAFTGEVGCPATPSGPSEAPFAAAQAGLPACRKRSSDARLCWLSHLGGTSGGAGEGESHRMVRKPGSRRAQYVGTVVTHMPLPTWGSHKFGVCTLGGKGCHC